MQVQWAALLAFICQIILSKGGKPGMCPPIVGGTRSSTPINRCQDDTHCEGKRKCCDTLIGMACMLPERGYVSTDSYKPTGEYEYTTTPSPMHYTATTAHQKPRPSQKCTGEGEEYSECAPLCPKGCDNLHAKPTCSGCKPGCKCKKGYHRLAVDDDTSPCVRNAVCEAMTSKENCPDGSVPTSVCRGKYKSCPSGSKCMNGLCCPPNAQPRPQPTIPTHKPGQCPTLIHNYGRWPSCSRDSDCSGTQKCCPTLSAGSVCQEPMAGFRTEGGKNRPLETVMKLLGLEQVMQILN